MSARSAILQAQQAVETAFGLSPADAEDVVSEAVLVVCLKWGGQYVENSALLRAVARHVARHLLRRRRALKEIPLELHREAQAPAAADYAAAEALLLKVCRAAGIDSAGDVSLLKMVLIDGLSYSEAEDALGASEDALRQRVSRLRGRLRDALAR